MLELACSLVFFGRCDEHGRDSSPHAGDCKRTPPPPPSLQYRHRQGTQGQRQVDAGLWTEKVGIAYNWAGATCPGAWLGSSHNPDAANNTLLFPRLARAASACPGLAIGCPGPPREPHGWGRMTCISRPPRSLQGAGSDEALVRVPGITPRAQSAWDYPQGSRLLAHATRRHQRRRDAPDSGLWLPGRQGRQEQTTAQDWERVHRAGGANPPFSVFLSIHGTARRGVPPGRVLSLHCPSLSFSGHPRGPSRADRDPLPAPHEHSPRTCTAGIVALTPARCLLAEADTTARDNCAVAWRDRGESPSGT